MYLIISLSDLLIKCESLTSGKKTLTRKLTIEAKSCNLASLIRNVNSVPVEMLRLLIDCRGTSVTADINSKITDLRVRCCRICW